MVAQPCLFFPSCSLSLRRLVLTEQKKRGIEAESRGIVLVVDDDEIVRTAVCCVLRANGHEVLMACNAEEAIAVFELNEASIDALVTDIKMPGMNGLELAAQIKQKKPTIKVIVMTGCMESAHGLDARRQQFTVVMKPFSFSILLDLL